MRVLSRLPDSNMFGFSKLVANEVTQPLWPSSVPRITNCSAMMGGVFRRLSKLGRVLLAAQDTQ